MKTVNGPVTLGRCLLGGLLTGIIASLIALVFNVIFRGAVHLSTYQVVAMPISIFVIFPLFGLIAGGFYSLFVGHVQKAPASFAIVMLAITALGALLTLLAWRTTNQAKIELKDLLTGMEVIAGLAAAFFIPFFVRHPGIYLTDKDIRGEE